MFTTNMDEIIQLKQRIEILEQTLGAILVSDKVLFKRHVQLLDGRDIRLGTDTGTKIGTGTSQKLGFYNVTPISQRTNASQAAVPTTGAANSTPWGYSTEAQANAIVTLVNELRSALVVIGIIKGS